MTFRELLGQGTQYLRECGIDDAAIDAWQLMEFVWNIDRGYYFIHSDDIIETEKRQEYTGLIKRRGTHIPLQYLTHRAFFMGLSFFVNEAVLIPRQDTETLVEAVLEQLPANGHILDLGTGSGCILISLLNERPDAVGTGADISPAALAVARKNAACLGCEAEFIESDLFDRVSKSFDVIVSNPPYIPSGEIPLLMAEVREHDPLLALDGKADGLYFYRKIISQAKLFLSENALLAFEIGHDQGSKVQEMMHLAGYKKIRIIKDLAGRDRVVTGRRS